VDSYELGLKRDFAGNFRLNAALFYSDYQGFQTPLTVPLGAITATQFLNLDATVWGLETEMQWSPVDNLQLFLNYAYLNTELTTGCCYVDTADPFALQPGANPTGAPLANGNRLQSLEGNSLPLAPENKVSLGGTYAWDLAAGTLTAGATYTYTADKQTTVFAQPGYTAGETQVADFRLLYRDIEDRYTIIGFVKNAFDEEGFDSSVVTTPSATGARQTVKPIFPRTFGVELQYRF